MKNTKLKGIFWRADHYGNQNVGGMFSAHYGFLNGFQKLGHECVFVSAGRLKLPPGVDYYSIPHSKIFRNFPEILNFPYNGRSVREMLKIIEKEKPDFIYQYQADFNYAGSIIKKKTGLPFFLQSDGVQSWIKKNWGKLYFPYLQKVSEEIQWEWADAIFVVSREIKDQMVHLGVDGEKIYILPSAVDPDKFHPDTDGTPVRKKLDIENKYIIGFSGSFGHWHGVEILAKAAPAIVSNIPGAFILFIGDGLLRPEIENIIRENNLEGQTHITGMLPYESVPEYLAACDVLTTPCVVSGEDEIFFNSPVKLFEYMAMQKPVIASAIGQQKEVISDRENGILIPQKDPDALAEAVHVLQKNKDLSERIALKARNDAVSKYDWRSISKIVLDVYDSISK